MKKLFYSFLTLAVTTLSFTSCEDVPAPYDYPEENVATPTTPTGSGTLEDPYNVAAALEKIKAMEADKPSEPMYVKGKIASIQSVETEKFGNANYYISDDGTTQNQLYIFQSLFLNKAKFTSAEQIKVGDEVVVYGPFVNYKGNTPETVGKGSSYIHSLNGTNSGTDTPTGQTSPITITELIGKMSEEGAVIDANSDRTFEAVVQADVTGKNNTRNNLPVAVEGATEAKQAVTLYGSQVDPTTLNLAKGDKVKITLKAGKAQAKNYQGLWEVTGGMNDTWCTIEKIGTATIKPVVVSAANIDRLTDYQGMTVTIENATTTDETKWGAGTHTFTAGGKNFTVYVNNGAVFAENLIDKTKTGSVTGIVTLYKGNAQIAPRTEEDVKAFSKPGENVTPTPQPSGEGMTLTDIENGKTGTQALLENAYGTQTATDEATWYTWTYDGVSYKGSRIAKAKTTDLYKGCLQVQGNDSDAAKQGFFFNSTAFAKDIKTITIVLKGASKFNTPVGHTVYAGSTANPTTNAITPKVSHVTEGSLNVFTETFDFSSGNYKFFKVHNDKVGALYIDKIIVTLK